MPDGPWLSAEEQQAWRSYVLMRRTLETHLARKMQQECGLSPSDFEILVNLSESLTGRMRAVELGAATQWEKSRISHHLRRMEKRGLIRRQDGDARYPDIVITDIGREAIRACAPANAARVRALFVDVLGPDRLTMLRQACEDVVAAVHEHQKLEAIARAAMASNSDTSEETAI
jgi:DNA-binding MarR family transcriptional regulator